jgi:hypothetical protein
MSIFRTISISDEEEGGFYPKDRPERIQNKKTARKKSTLFYAAADALARLRKKTFSKPASPQ